jgi:hypothetical protein
MGNVAALGVGDDQQPGLAGGADDPLERRPSGRAEPLEAGELRLRRDAGGGGERDQPLAFGDDRLARRLPRVEPEAELASPPLDGGGEPVGEWGG